MRAPSSYDGRQPVPVVIAFHGVSGDSSTFDKKYNFRRDVGEHAVLVFPDALVFPHAGSTTWMDDAPDDLAFFDAIVSWLGANICIDRGRLFVTGHSSGASFSNTLGCKRGDVIRGIAAVSGGSREMRNCQGSPAVWLANGTNDTSVPVETGADARDFWLDRNGCAATSQPTTPRPCTAYEGCADGGPVHWCEFDGGHVWPAFANIGLWSFFSEL